MLIILTVPIQHLAHRTTAQSVQFLIVSQMNQLSEIGKKGNVNSD